MGVLSYDVLFVSDYVSDYVTLGLVFNISWLCYMSFDLFELCPLLNYMPFKVLWMSNI